MARPTRTTAIPNQETPYDAQIDPQHILRRSRVRRYAESGAWIVTAVVAARFADLPTALQDYGYGVPFYLLFVSLLGFIMIFLYLTLYIPYTTGSSVDLTQWQTQAPRTIQLATICGVVAGIAANWMLWPAYRWLTPVLTFVEFMGVISFIGLF
ncbi:hypothetical protein HK104_010592 [Borealophlyctis nickersoniae]|nr:hypothetical protein HK104_010592 [Borealophlyctis nickersoniae]